MISQKTFLGEIQPFASHGDSFDEKFAPKNPFLKIA